MPRCTATTIAGAPCRAWAKGGSDPARCPHHLGTRGHLSKFTPEVIERIVSLLAAGNYEGTTAAAAGITPKTFYVWLRRGAPDGRAADRPYRDFRHRVERAQSEGEARNVALIARAATDNWQAAAWLLERRYPERWARPSQRGQQEPAAEPEPAADPFSEVDELAQRRTSQP